MTDATPHRVLDRVVTSAIVLNAVVFIWSLIDHAHEHEAEMIENVILAFFVIELAWKAHLYRRGFFKDRWHVFDVVVIGVSLLPLVPGMAPLARLAKLAKMLHLTRHTAQLRLAQLTRR